MSCPRCKAQNALANHHNERIVCLFCGWYVEPIEMGMTEAAREVMQGKLEMILG